MDRRRAAGALLALAACFACATAAPTASNQTALDLYDTDSTEGCYYNFQHYGEGDRIMTNEPCLNCTCHNRMLMCYLRVCPFTKPIGQDCTVEKRADQCCPIVTCPDVPVDLLTSTPTTSPAEYGTTGVGRLDKYGCSINGKYFSEGAKVPPSPNKPCEHCYCIRNMTTCVMQECTLHVDGCTPIYHKEVCCPIRYSCDHQDDEVPMLDDMTTTVRPTPGFLLTTTTVASVTQIPQECVHEDQIFPDGALIKTEKACEHCYCMKGDIVCVVQECGTPMENEGKNCTSLAPREGQCCPDTYICEGDEVPTELTTELPFEAATEVPTEITTEQATELKKEETTKLPSEEATEKEKESSTEEPKQVSTQVATDDVTEVQTETVPEVPKEVVTEVPTEDETKVQKEEVTEVPTEKATEVQKESTTEAPTEEETEIQKESSTEEPKDASTQRPTEEVTELQKESVTEALKEEVSEVPIDDVTEVQKETTTEVPKEATTDSATDTATQAGTEAAVKFESETSTEGSGQAITDIASKGTTEAATEVTNDAVSDDLTQAATEAATEEPHHTVSEVAPNEPIEEPTTFTPPRRTSVEGSGYRNEPDEIFTESPFLEPEGSGDENGLEKPTGSEETSIPIEETTLPVHDLDSEVTTAKDNSMYSPSSTEPSISYTEQTTTEPDKGENTVPSDDILPSIFDVTTSESPVTIQASEETTPAFEQKTEISSEDKQGEQPTVTVPEAFTTVFTEKPLPTEPALEDAKVTETPPESTTGKETEEMITEKPVAVTSPESATGKETEEMITEKPVAVETISPTTEKEALDIQTTVLFDEKESKSTTVQLPDTPTMVETVKQEKATTETVQEYTTPENKKKDQDLYTTMQPEIEESKTTTIRGDLSETTSINPLENEIHEDGTPNLTPGLIPGEGNCLVDGITYNNDSAVPISQKCQSNCRCMSSIVKCEEIMCSPQPENMGNCQAVYESEETCCPYYTCDQAKETPPLKPHSQMSGTELPVTQSNCSDEICDKTKVDEGTTAEISPQCISGDCSSETDTTNTELCGATGCGDQQVPVLIPTKEEAPAQSEVCADGKCISPPKDCTEDNCQLPTRKDCSKDEPCDVSPQETCEGPSCGVDTIPAKESSKPAQESPQGCANPEDCKSSSPDIAKPTCEGEECTFIKQDCTSEKCESTPVEVPIIPDEQQQEACSDENGCKKTDQSQVPKPECTDEACIKKDVTDIEVKPTSVCSDDSCVQQATTTPSSDIVGPLSTELPETVDKLQTELPATIDTETEKEMISDVSVTDSIEVTSTTQPATQKHETETAIPEATTAEIPSQEPHSEEISTKTPEVIDTEPQEITTDTPKITNLPDVQEAEKATAVTESQEIEQPQTESSISVPITTAAAELEEEKPEDVTYKQDIVTEAPVEATSLETRLETTEPSIMETSVPAKVDEESTESDIIKLPSVSEREEINTELPETLPTESYKEPEESTATGSQEKEQPIPEEPAATEGLLEEPVTESQSDFVTTGDNNLMVEISKVPEEKDVTKSPEQATEILEAVTEAQTQHPTQDELSTKSQEIETTKMPFLDEQVTVTEGLKKPVMEPEESVTKLPVVPIMDEKDNTESPEIYTKYATTVSFDQPDATTKAPESFTTEIYDVHTKAPEMPMSEEQFKHTVIPETPVTESQDAESTLVDQEHTTPSVYPVTEPQGVTDGLQEAAFTEKEISDSDSSVTESQETETKAPSVSPSEEQETITEQPATEPQEITVKPESPVTETQEIETKVPKEQEIVPTSPVSEQENVVTEVTKAATSEEKEKPTEAPITGVPKTETKSPELSAEQEAAQPHETITSTTEHSEQDDEKTTKSPEIISEATEKQDINTESPEIPTTEAQKAGTEGPEIITPQEEDKATEIYEPVTESQETVTKAADGQEISVTQQEENVTGASKVPEEELEHTTETQEFVTKAPEVTSKAPEGDEQQTTVKVVAELPEYEKPTEVQETDTKVPEVQDVKTEVPLAPVTEPQDISTLPVEQQDVKQAEEEKPTEIPESPVKEHQDIFTTTKAPLSEQDTQTHPPEDTQDTITQLPDVALPEEPEKQSESPESLVTDFQDMTTKVSDTDEQSETQVTTISGEPESPVTETRKTDIENLEPSKPEEQEVYTNAPEITVFQETGTTPTAEKEIPVTPVTHFDETSTGIPEATIQEDIEKQTMIPEFHVTESHQIDTEAPELQDVQTEAPALPVTETQEAFTNVPIVLVPEEEPTESPPVEAQEPATIAPELPIQEGSLPESPIEEPQESSVPKEPIIPEDKVTEIPETDITELQGIMPDSPIPAVTEKQSDDVPVTEFHELGSTILDERIGSTEQSVTQTSQSKLEYSETTPYLVELEEHTHKIEVETSTVIPEDISVPQTTEVYDKSEKPTENQTEPPMTTEKSMKVSSVEPITDTESGSPTPQEQSTPSDIDDTRRTTISSEELEDKIPEEAVPVPILPVTEKEAEPTVQPEAETEKYTTAQPTEKPMEATSSQEVSSEEDSIPLKTTTVKSAEEASTFAPIDKTTTPEPKPTELPSPVSQETAKPTSNEEVPSEEDAGQFPPSGTGYGQEPDYAEEDQAFGPGTCRYGGKVYVSAQQIPRDDPCDFCFCFRSDIICLQQSCPPPIHGCHEEPIQGFCCPRYECPVSMATTLNMTTTTTTTTTTLPPHFLTHAYNGAAQKRGCMVKGHTYKVGEVVRASSGPCLHCTCGGDGQMKCDPKVCTPEPMLRQMIAAAVSAKRRR